MSKWIVYAIGVFFVLGGVDSLIGNKMGLGNVFLDTLKKMGMVMLGVLGIYSLAPVAAGGIQAVITPVAHFLRMEPAVFPAMIFPIDMGGYNLSTLIQEDAQLGAYFAVVVSAICGAAIGYTIPISVNMVDKRFFSALSLGTLSGIVAIPVGCLAGALLAGIAPLRALWNLLPLTLLAALLAVGLFRAPERMAKIFVVFGRIMSGIALIGLVLQGAQLIFGVTILPGMADLREALEIVARIVYIMAGAMTMLTVIKKLLKKPLAAAGRLLGINETAAAGVLAAMVSVLLTYVDIERMDERGRVLTCAYCAGGAFVLGGQLGLASTLAPQLIPSFVLAKYTAGFCGMALAYLLYRRQEKKGGAHDKTTGS